MIADVASALSTSLGYTVYYGDLPDAEDGSLDEAVALVDFAMGKPTHDFGEADPVYTPYGIAVTARSTSQTSARALCLEVYGALLSAGYTAVCPPVSLGQDGTRWLIGAQVQAHEIRS